MTEAQMTAKKRTKRIVEKVLTFAIGAPIAIFVLLHMRMFIGSVWLAAPHAGRYSIVGADGRTMDLAISDNGTVTTEYLDDDGELHVSSARWRGSPATRIIGPIYKPEGYFYRWVERGTEPIIMEAEYTGLSPSDSDVFPKPGRRVTSLVYFRDDAVKFDGMWLKKNDR